MSRLALAAILVMGLIAASPSEAHALLAKAAPRVGATVRQAPATLRLTFTERIEPAFSRITLEGNPGGALNLGPIATAPGDPRTLVAAVRSALPTGVYRVRWWVVSVDTHVTQGDFTFRIQP